MEIQYDKEIEVTEKQYKFLIVKLKGIIAFRDENNKFFIKVWAMSYSDYIQKLLSI